MKRTTERETLFDRDFLADLKFWIETDLPIAARILELTDATRRNPCEGPGKPEPLRHALAGCWARRITQEHRLVYRVTETRIDFPQARHHY